MAVGTFLAEPGLCSQRLPVTAFTANIRVRAVEREIRLCLVIEAPLQPVDRNMTLPARFPEASFVRVTLTVTADAVFLGVLENVRVVASIALLIGMNAEQWESRQIVVEEDVVRPCMFVVAVKAKSALGSLVGVVILMADQAILDKLDLEDRLDVARDTLSQCMGPLQRIGGLDSVIELDIHPLIIDVAGIAGGTEVPVVVVVLEVTGNAGDIQRVGERIVAMAGVAGELAVAAVERETRVAPMIEAGIGPAGRRMTVLAFLSSAAVMCVIRRMAGVAIRFRGLELAVDVAGRAGRVHVFAGQWEFGRIMIELDLGPAQRGMAAATLGAD